jgi:hypothetical protein
VFGSRLLRKVFGAKRDELTEGWKNLHNEELRDLYTSLSIISYHIAEDGVVRAYNGNGEKRNVYRLLVGEREGKRPLRTSRHGCVDDIKLALVRLGWSGVNWIGMAQDWRALVTAVMNLRVP